MKLWVIYSNKHENSMVTKTMQKTAKQNGIDCKILFFEYFSFLVENETQKLYYKSKLITSFPDVAMARGYNVQIRSFLENCGTKFVNSTKGALTTLDKLESHFVASRLKMNQPKTLFGNLTFDEIAKKLTLPFVMKNRFGMKGENVFLVKSKTAFLKIKKENPNIEFLFQEYVESSKGFDIRLYVVGNNVVGAVKRISKNGDFRSNLSLGGTSQPFFAVSQKIKNQALKFAQTLNLHFCSIDFLQAKTGLVFCEANANASYQAFFESGIDIQNFVMNYIKTQK